MAVGEAKGFSKVLVFLALLCGAVVFAFPFLDMVFTSVKLDDEMATENYRFLPKQPIPRWASPYASEDPDRKIERPADMPAATWKAFEKPFTETVREQIGKWWEAQAFIKQHYANVSRERAIETLTQAVGSRVLGRIPDTARQSGIEAMLAQTRRLTDHETIMPVFQQEVRRFALGEVRVRLSDFSRRAVGEAEDWRVVGGPATLAVTAEPLDKGAQATLTFTEGGQAAVFRTDARVPATAAATQESASAATQLAPLSPREAGQVDRVYISYLPDRSWSKMEVFVIRDGQRYQMKEPLYADDIRWNELELRWPNPEEDKTAGRSYRLLEPAENGHGRDGGDPEFAVEVKLTPNSTLGAWWAKATRNYNVAFMQVPIGRYIMTSVALAILNIVLVVFASSFAAYAFARVEFPGRDVLFGVLLATMMIPGQVTMIPTFLIYKNLGWFNTLLPLWVPSAFGTAFFIFMARQFLKSVPKELEEAARIDGCGFLRIYWHVMLPLIRPTVAAIALFAFQGTWNNFMGPLIYVNDERMFNLAFGLFKFQLISGSSNSLMMAGAFIMTLPLIITFFLFQRYFVQGISLSGLGGR